MSAGRFVMLSPALPIPLPEMIPSVVCFAGHRVHATQAEDGRWFVPGYCPVCEHEASA